MFSDITQFPGISVYNSLAIKTPFLVDRSLTLHILSMNKAVFVDRKNREKINNVGNIGAVRKLKHYNNPHLQV